jgi:hypothetical protein
MNKKQRKIVPSNFIRRIVDRHRHFPVDTGKSTAPSSRHATGFALVQEGVAYPSG